MFTITMNFERSTKNTHVYQAVTPGSRIRTLYIDRDKSPPPTTITVAVTDASFDT